MQLIVSAAIRRTQSNKVPYTVWGMDKKPVPRNKSDVDRMTDMAHNAQYLETKSHQQSKLGKVANSS